MAEHDLEQALGYHFADPALLVQALTHRSWPAEHEGAVGDNERLEFLGDAVLSLAIAERLHGDTEMSEGEMSRVRATVVDEAALATVGRALGLSAHLRLGKGEDDDGGRHKPSILSDAVEAVLGALYIDGGLGAARRFVDEHWTGLIAEGSAVPGISDHKTRLQEMLAADGLRPVYTAVGEGLDHAMEFSAAVVALPNEEAEGARFDSLDDLPVPPLGEGTGTSKKRAEQAAAGEAIAFLEKRGA